MIPNLISKIMPVESTPEEKIVALADKVVSKIVMHDMIKRAMSLPMSELELSAICHNLTADFVMDKALDVSKITDSIEHIENTLNRLSELHKTKKSVPIAAVMVSTLNIDGVIKAADKLIATDYPISGIVESITKQQLTICDQKLENVDPLSLTDSNIPFWSYLNQDAKAKWLELIKKVDNFKKIVIKNQIKEELKEDQKNSYLPEDLLETNAKELGKIKAENELFSRASSSGDNSFKATLLDPASKEYHNLKAAFETNTDLKDEILEILEEAKTATKSQVQESLQSINETTRRRFGKKQIPFSVQKQKNSLLT